MYAVYTNSYMVACKTRPDFNPRDGLTGRSVEYTEVVGAWYEPELVVSGLTAEQAERIASYMQKVTRITEDAREPIEAAARRLAKARREAVAVHEFWVEAEISPPVGV